VKSYCIVSEAFDTDMLNAKNFKPPLRMQFVALWDTGATNSVILENVVVKLGLKPTGMRNVNHANGVNTYDINILLENDIVFQALEVSQGILTGMDVLIGMDIISTGDFAITTSQGKTKFSFQMPSTHDIDLTRANNFENY
jgi:hypothetical protein